MPRSTVEQLLRCTRHSLDVFVLVGGTLLHTNRDAFTDCGRRGVAIRFLFPGSDSPWLKEYIQAARLSLDDYRERIRGNAELARELVPSAAVRYHCDPVPAWFLLGDRAMAATKPVAFFSDPGVELTTDSFVLARFCDQFEVTWATATEDETGPSRAPNDTLQELLELLDRVSDSLRELRKGVQQALQIAEADPEMALARVRKVLEFLLRDTYQRRVGKPPGTQPLENLIQNLVNSGHFPVRLAAYATTVRLLGNVGVHRFDEGIVRADVNQSLMQLRPILDWFLVIERPDGLKPPATA